MPRRPLAWTPAWILVGLATVTAVLGLACEEQQALGEQKSSGERAKGSDPSTTTPPSSRSGVSAASEPSPSNPPSVAPVAVADPATLERGKGLYGSTCASCHGPDGSGAVMRAVLPELTDLSDPATHARLTDEAIGELVAKGKNKMPPFEVVLKPEDIRAIVAYTRTLKKP